MSYRLTQHLPVLALLAGMAAPLAATLPASAQDHMQAPGSAMGKDAMAPGSMSQNNMAQGNMAQGNMRHHGTKNAMQSGGMAKDSGMAHDSGTNDATSGNAMSPTPPKS